MITDLFSDVHLGYIAAYEGVSFFLIYRNVFFAWEVSHHAVLFIRVRKDLGVFLGRFCGVSEHALEEIRVLGKVSCRCCAAGYGEGEDYGCRCCRNLAPGLFGIVGSCLVLAADPAVSVLQAFIHFFRYLYFLFQDLFHFIFCIIHSVPPLLML